MLATTSLPVDTLYRRAINEAEFAAAAHTVYVAREKLRIIQALRSYSGMAVPRIGGELPAACALLENVTVAPDDHPASIALQRMTHLIAIKAPDEAVATAARAMIEGELVGGEYRHGAIDIAAEINAAALDEDEPLSIRFETRGAPVALIPSPSVDHAEAISILRRLLDSAESNCSGSANYPEFARDVTKARASLNVWERQA